MQEEQKIEYNFVYLLGIALVAALGGFLFGYDLVVIGGAKEFYELEFGLTSKLAQGWAVSSCIVGCIIGALCVGPLADKLGRKKMLFGSALLFFVSAIGSGYAPTFTLFVIFRMIGGIGMGIASTVSPMYIAEVSPEAIRGRVVAIQQLAIVLGILLAQLVNYLILQSHPLEAGLAGQALLETWNGQTGWRWMFAAEGIPALLFFLFLIPVPNSPRWLCRMEKFDQAEKVLARIGGTAYAETCLKDIKESLKNSLHLNELAELTKPKMNMILIIGIVIAVFSQWCGINVVFNYAHDIFKEAGYNVEGVFLNLLIVGLTNFLFTIVAMLTIDKLGRKRLMLIGSFALAFAFFCVGAFFYTKNLGIPVLAFLLLAIAIFASTIGPVTWVLLSEIFPNRVRGMATSIAVMAMWIANFLLALTFPVMVHGLGFGVTFWIYAGICFAGGFFVLKYVPEPKGKTLEQLEKELVD